MDRGGKPVALGDPCGVDCSVVEFSQQKGVEQESFARAGLAVVPTGVAGTTVSAGFSPVFRGGDFKRVFLRAAAGRERDAGDGEADHLTLTAAQAADRVAHEEDLFEI